MMVKSQEHSCAEYKEGDIVTVSYEAQLWGKKDAILRYDS